MLKYGRNIDKSTDKSTQNCCGDISPNAKETNTECTESQRYKT